MPYETISGSYERASRLGHATAAIRALADHAEFFVPAERLGDTTWVRERVVSRADLENDASAPLVAALAIDGSHVVEAVRDGMPSVVYGYAQAAAAFVDLDIMESQRKRAFVDPLAVAAAVNSALISIDLPVAGAYAREGIDIKTSWRELVYALFQAKKVQVNRLDQSLLDLLMLLHGEPGSPASTVPVKCPREDCPPTDVAIASEPGRCSQCGERLYATDTLRVHEAVGSEGTNEEALGRLRSVVELLVLVGLATLLWEQSRSDLLASTLFILDGPLAMYGEPAKLRGRAEHYFQAMAATTPGAAPYLCGIEKSGAMVDYARQLAHHDVLHPGEVMICDEVVLGRVVSTSDPLQYGKETYWGRKFVFRASDGRVVVPTVMPAAGAAYDSAGGQRGPAGYPTLAAILDVIDRTGSSMYRDGIIPVAAAHGKAAFPIGVGTDVLRLVAKKKLGLDGTEVESGR